MNKIKLTLYNTMSVINGIFALLIFFYEYTNISSVGEKDLEFWIIQTIFLLIFIIPVIVFQVLNLISEYYKWKRIFNILLCILLEIIFICYYAIIFMGFCLPIEELY